MGDRWHPITEEEIDYAVQLVIEEGMKPAPAARMAEERFRQNSWKSIANKITKDPRYIEHVRGKPESVTTIPMSVLEGVRETIASNPTLPMIGCIRKYMEETGCPLSEDAIRNKYRREILDKDPNRPKKMKTGWDSSDYTNFWTLDEWKRRGLIKAKE